MSAGDLSSSVGTRALTGQQAGECLSCSFWFTTAPGGVVMNGAQRAALPRCTSRVTEGPCSGWPPDSCPSLQWQRMKQPYIIGQLCPLRLWQTKPAESIKSSYNLCTLKPCLGLFILFPYSKSPPCLLFSPLLCFPDFIFFLFRTKTPVNIIFMCPSIRPQVNIPRHRGAVSLDRRGKKKKAY